MAKRKKAKKDKQRHDKPVLTAEEESQLQMLMDRVLALDPEANSFTQFVESLKPLVQQSVAFTVAFAETLGSTANPVAVKLIQALQGMEAKKPVRRALKTALYRLARQGLVKEQEEAEVEPRVLVPRPEDRQAEAWASWPESQGERGIILKVPDAGRGYLMVIGVLNSEGVFHEFEAVQTTRKGVKALLEKMTGGVSGRIIEIPLDHFRFLYEEVAATYQRQSMELPAGYDVMLKQLDSWAEKPSGPHIYNLLDEKEIGEDTLLLRSSDGLLEVQPFVSWRLPVELVNPFAAKIKEFRESRLVISQSSQLERVEQIYREAATELFTAERRQRYRRLLEEAALLLYLENREQEAKRAFAVALDLQKEVGVFSENNFVLGLVKRSIVAEVGSALEDMEGQRQREKTTESGLIIPR
ncbi:MAG: hypothetical protein JSU80_13380 [Deltaproteobacteria bacterium]|nr:MAG: hypothetical protein JSU80_13380 [Deltaproteobacteria bacterium]